MDEPEPPTPAGLGAALWSCPSGDCQSIVLDPKKGGVLLYSPWESIWNDTHWCGFYSKRVDGVFLSGRRATLE